MIIRKANQKMKGYLWRPFLSDMRVWLWSKGAHSPGKKPKEMLHLEERARWSEQLVLILKSNRRAPDVPKHLIYPTRTWPRGEARKAPTALETSPNTTRRTSKHRRRRQTHWSTATPCRSTPICKCSRRPLASREERLVPQADLVQQQDITKMRERQHIQRRCSPKR